MVPSVCCEGFLELTSAAEARLRQEYHSFCLRFSFHDVISAARVLGFGSRNVLPDGHHILLCSAEQPTT
ncbi:hypothetical protein PROFUN_08837 [Planoprotostelium fungivorum]|uniref:Uncharacterized protein n=1 Tax=Planoprotostelium fungivorum TaxID=1890364 RepID=A0A2P6NIW5_9EUKA|nr:hypothetical protein PROFUN_08837 [Planoprotostelium fungivorum]